MLSALVVLIFLTYSNIYTVTGSNCSDLWFDCGNGKCVGLIWRCDDFNDCGNFKDEENCDSGIPPRTCLSSQFQCVEDGHCITETWHCDGESDCEDGSDEKNCENNTHCSGFRCKDNHCIPEKWKCDGRRDCPDGSDEDDQCPKSSQDCGPAQFKCTSGSCIEQRQVCDGKKDCSDASDEGRQCSDVCAEHTCSQKCRRTPKGPECYCNEGYQLDRDNKTCTDINECRIEGTCSQICTNLMGSYKCSCIDGYYAENNTCKARGAEPVLIFSNGDEIRGFYLRTKRYFLVHKAFLKASALDADPLESRVYWLEPSNSSKVYSSKLDGSSMTVALSNGLMIPEDIAVDYVARNLYFTDSGLKQIVVCKMEGTVCHALHTTDIHKPRSIAVDPAEGLLYWSDWGEKSSGIYRSGMDGSRRSTLVSTDIKWPNGMTIDHTTNRLYWIDANLRTIEYVSLDGTERKVLLKEEIYHPYSVSVFEDNLYWSDWDSYSLETCNKFTSHKMNILTREKEKHIFGVHVYHPVQARRADNPCWSNTCSHMCLIAPSNGFKCVCPPGYNLASNGETCKIDDSFPVLIVNDENSIYQIKPESVGSGALSELPITHIDEIGRIAYDWKTKTLYVVDIKAPAIYAVNISTLMRRDLVKTHLVTPQDLAFDWMSENLYWVDTSKGTVELVSTKTNLRTSVIVDLSKPSAIVLVPQIGRMFISTIGDEPSISMFNMDGSNRVELIKRTSAVSLAVHPSESLLYWADPQEKTISYLDYKSSRIEEKVLLSHLSNVMSIAVSDKYLYWTDTSSHALNYLKYKADHSLAINLPGNRNRLAPRRVLYSAMPKISRALDSPCSMNKGGCSHLCLTSETGRTCACPIGMVLSNNRLTCTKKNCTSDEFQCKSTKKCVPKVFLCDGIKDCEDGSDETCDVLAGSVKPCPVNDFRCANGRCILNDWKCDHNDDCGDNSDEIGCPPPTTCAKDQMSCSGGECVPLLWKCDGDQDCTDGADEKDCHATACGEMQLRCDHGQCIPKSWACDGTMDCNDGTDERNCTAKPKTCLFKEFRCDDGSCIDKKLVCDQRKDCDDASDERNCTHSLIRCEGDKFLCKDGKCIYKHEVCDHHIDCTDGEDELNCTQTAAECTQEEYFCLNNSKCITRRWICDGDNDCGDEADEEPSFCLSLQQNKPTLPSFKEMRACDEFFCEYSGGCIPWTKVCDGVPDCQDLTDEGTGCKTACFDNGGCSQKCTKTPSGSLCSCITGYRLMEDEVTCEDIDECSIPGYCSQICNNTKGGFKCSCLDGYVLEHDHRKCKADGVQATLVYLLPDEIRGIQMGSNNLRVIYNERNADFRGLDYDAAESKFFWAEWKSGTLNSYALNTNEKTTLLTTSIRPNSLRWDWLTRTFFYTNDDGSIVACDESGKYCATTVPKVALDINSFDISPKKGIMFWSVWNILRHSQYGIIERADLDGNNRMTIVEDNTYWPFSVTVDELTNRIFWSDLKSYLVEHADFRGRQRKILLQGKLYNPMSMTIFEDYLFWSDNNDTIYRCNKFSGLDCAPVHSDNVKAAVTLVFHVVKQPKGENRCLGNKCPHLCLPNRTGSRCVCADNYEEFNSTCSLVPMVSTTQRPKPNVTCTPNYCQRNGRCIVSGGRLNCQCPPDYLGDVCERRAEAAGPEPTPDVSWIVIVLLALLVIGLIVLAYLLCQKNRDKFSRMSENVAVTFRKSGFGRKSSRLIVDTDDGGACDELMLGQADTLKKPSRSFGNPLFGKKPRGLPDPESQNDGDFKRWPSFDSGDSAFVSESQIREDSQHRSDSNTMSVKNFADRLGDFFSRN